MGGEGSMAAANNSLKNNRNLLKNKRKGSLSGSSAAFSPIGHIPPNSPRSCAVRPAAKTPQNGQLYVIFLRENVSLFSLRKTTHSCAGSYAYVELNKFPDATPEQLNEIKKRIKREQKLIRNK